MLYSIGIGENRFAFLESSHFSAYAKVRITPFFCKKDEKEKFFYFEVIEKDL